MKCMILNERLQRLGTPYTFKSSPKDVVVFSRSELALTMGKQKIICIMSVDSDNVISLTREISTSCEYFSICCITPTNMVVSTSNNPCHVRMISVDGVETDFDHLEFHKKTYKQGESMSTYVKPKNTLLLTDRFAHTVYMYNTVKGTTNAVTDRNIKEPRGACVGPSDTVLVCSSLNNSIVHLTVGGEILGKYPVYMQHPFSLCVSTDGNMLAVANN
ncbi:hypothetical protein DPMN_133783 [Dreissena polymorpha]|uniref:Uncharacterized protein n=2 Tax=Dreissena polymorpha TaxID=45954 RepID=A0A9D4FUX7_DREPO|nr:hypothetical protein DPMN_133783 [Dreissena polymorpha]